MSNNVQTVKEFYAAFMRGDAAYIMERVTADVLWIFEGPATVPWAGTLSGPEQAVFFFENLAMTNSDIRFVMNLFVAEGDYVASFGRYASTIGGRRGSTPIAHLFRFENGKLAEFRNHANTAAYM